MTKNWRVEAKRAMDKAIGNVRGLRVWTGTDSIQLVEAGSLSVLAHARKSVAGLMVEAASGFCGLTASEKRQVSGVIESAAAALSDTMQQPILFRTTPRKGLSVVVGGNVFYRP